MTLFSSFQRKWCGYKFWHLLSYAFWIDSHPSFWIWSRTPVSSQDFFLPGFHSHAIHITWLVELHWLGSSQFIPLKLKVTYNLFVDKIFLELLKTVAFIAGKKNPAVQKLYIRFSIEIKLKKLFQRWDSIQNSI